MKNRLLVERAAAADGEDAQADARASAGARSPAGAAIGDRDPRRIALGLAQVAGICDQRQYDAGREAARRLVLGAARAAVTMSGIGPPDNNARAAPAAEAPTMAQHRRKAPLRRGRDHGRPGPCRRAVARRLAPAKHARGGTGAWCGHGRARQALLGFALERLADHYRIR